MIAYLCAALRDFWDAFWWDTADCGCAYSMGRHPRVRPCQGHDYAENLISAQLTGGGR